MTNYYAPTFRSKQFHCIHCGVYAKQEWNKLAFTTYSDQVSPISWCQCAHCSKMSYWFEEKMVIPATSPAPPAHIDTPQSILSEYNEARAIFGISPRAAVALLRLAIQKLMVELGEKGENINADIKSLVAKGLPIQVQQAFDYCRVVGNNAVHPGEINLNDSPEMGQHLFNMINFIVEDRITRPHHIAALYGKLPETAREAIEKRDV